MQTELKNTQIEYISIDKVKPYEKNARFNDKAVDAVAKSIQEYGFKNPIIVDENYIIIAGHTRLKAAQKIKLATVPVIVASDLTPQQVKAFRLADNKTGELAKHVGDKVVVPVAKATLYPVKQVGKAVIHPVKTAQNIGVGAKKLGKGIKKMFGSQG